MDLRASSRAALMIVVVGVAGSVIVAQGWRSRVTDVDIIRSVDAAHALVEHGVLPDRGTPSSLQSYIPPGTAWLVVPGVLAFADMRLSELPGSLALHFGTLAGIFLLARRVFGTRAAYMAVLLYGLSQPGLFFASTVWPRAHAFFYVWMAYWTYLWSTTKRPWYAGAVVAAWLAGNYLHLELVPAIVMLPAAWVFYRPPISWKAMATAVFAALVLWLPYLRFESTRGFIDLRSQMLRQTLTVDDKAGWCDPSLPLTPVLPEKRLATAGGTPSFSTRTMDFGEGVALSLVANFQGRIPGSGLLLLAIAIAGVVAMARPHRVRAEREASRTRVQQYAIAAWILLILSALLNEWSIARVVSWDGVLAAPTIWTIRALQLAAVLGSVGLLNHQRLRRMALTHGLRLDAPAGDPRPLLVSLALPWLLLLLVAEPGFQYRFLGLWSLQVIVISGLWARLASTSKVAVWYRSAAGLVILACVVCNSLVVNRIDAWRRSGWSGTDADHVQAIDYLASRLRAEGRQQAAIGYRLLGMADVAYPGPDRRGKAGPDFDALLEYRHGMTNTDRCPEGTSPEDAYQIVELRPPLPGESYFINKAPPPSAVRLREFGNFAVDKTPDGVR